MRQISTTPFVSVNVQRGGEEEAISAAYKRGLEKTRLGSFARLSGIFKRGAELSKEVCEEIEEVLVSGDLGTKTAGKVTANLQQAIKLRGDVSEKSVRDELKKILKETVSVIGAGGGIIAKRKEDGKPHVVMVVGVNGVGKTTTIGKLANRFKAGGAKVLLVACDTFRAAAGEQLSIWAERAGCALEAGVEGEKPATVAYRGIHRAEKEKFDVVIIDTAGRLHTRVNLMNELEAVFNIVGREQAGAPHDVLLVLDATTGQNALVQAREFHGRVKLSGIIVTKLDGTAKGGIVVAIADELQIPVRYIGVGEGIDDLREFSAAEFVKALCGEEETTPNVPTTTEIRRARRSLSSERTEGK